MSKVQSSPELTGNQASPRRPLAPADTFPSRHIGPRESEIQQMLEGLGYASLGQLVDDTVPEAIRTRDPLALPAAKGEFETQRDLRERAERNEVARSLIGLGFHEAIVPPVIQRNIFENPGWYTQYTPYQPEIAQGRLEALVNFQTVITDLTALDVAGASLLDEPTAAAEGMAMCVAATRRKKLGFFVADHVHPHTIEVVRTRAWSMGLELHVGPVEEIDFEKQDLCGVLVQQPDTHGRLRDPEAFASLASRAHEAGALVVAAADLLSLTLVPPPGEWGADIAVGNTQRFGVPLGGGGPHAAYLACREKLTRRMPGRLASVSVDARGRPAYRLAIQTREQHIKRDRATSNICTSQVLLAIMAGMYAVYHGPEGLRRSAERIHRLTVALAEGLERLGYDVGDHPVFDTLRVEADAGTARAVHEAARSRNFNLRAHEDGAVGVALDEATSPEEIEALWAAFAEAAGRDAGMRVDAVAEETDAELPEKLRRTSGYLDHEVFHRYRSEHEMLRYIKRLESGDLSLTTSMIPLGSCTMKLNSAAEMLTVTWPEWQRVHPFAPVEQQAGFRAICDELEQWLARVTGFAAVSLQPNAGSQGEYAGLLAIRRYHEARGDHNRQVCLIPESAHGTNPASAVIAGYEVVPVGSAENGDIDLDELKEKAEKHADRLGAIMVTYPSTHGVFEQGVADLCRIVHENGGLVFMDGANLNAQLGLCRPAEIGADVCHLNLHKTFCIPHGGGGPGVGPIGVAEHLQPYLPGDPREEGSFAVSGTPEGSQSILPISWMYIAMMGDEGLTRASQVAILNANYMAHRLSGHYDVLYTGANGRVAHEFILDCRPFEKSAGITVEDIAKRLMDFGFHAPTMSWPVPGSLMVEPTESESKEELDRFCDAMIAIRQEIDAVEKGRVDGEDNPLKGAPHTADMVATDDWRRGYRRDEAAYPADWLREHKFWPPVARIDNVYGDRHLVCTCPPMSAFK